MTFTADISKFIEITKRNTNKFARTFVEILVENVDELSPVGDPSLWLRGYASAGYEPGHYRRNNQVQIGSFPDDVKAGVDPDGSTAINENNLVISAIKAGDIVFVGNPVIYAGMIEAGWSSQAPLGVYNIAIAEYKSYMQQAAARI